MVVYNCCMDYIGTRRRRGVLRANKRRLERVRTKEMVAGCSALHAVSLVPRTRFGTVTKATSTDGTKR